MSAADHHFRDSLRLFLPYFAMLKPVRRQFIGALLCGLVYGAASGFGFPFMAYKVFPVIFADPPPGRWAIVGAAAILPLAFLIRGLSHFGNAYLSARCGIHVLRQIQARQFFRLQELSLSFFGRNRHGDLMARVMTDAVAVQHVVTVVSNDLIRQPVTFLGAIGSLVYMAFRNHQLVFVLFALAVIPVCAVPVSYLGRKMVGRAKQLQRSGGTINAVLHENLAAVREVRAFNLQEREKQRFVGLLETIGHHTLRIARYTHLVSPTVEVISSLGIAVAIVYAAATRMGLEAVLPLMTALYMTYDPIKKLGGLHNQIRRGEVSIERLEHVLRAPVEIAEPEQPVPFVPNRTDIAFDHVTFGYGEEPVLRDLQVHIPAGSVTALVGPSGAGKSTFVNLLPRFYDVQYGAIRIGGVDVRQFTTHDLRGHISIVSQDTVLFNDTLRNNIRVGRPEASDAEVEEAARHAFAHDFITRFPDGYETRAGERGLRLSGGQKQRIAIARAFLKNAPILIMDEATSSLDSESEEMVQRALGELIRAKTVLIIAHRFSTIKMADRILVMDAGRIRAAGTHAELHATDELYRSLYDRQFIG